MSNFIETFIKKVTKDKVDPADFKKAEQLIDSQSLNNRIFRSGRIVDKSKTPVNRGKYKKRNLPPIPKEIGQRKTLSASFEDVRVNLEYFLDQIDMADFSFQDFHRMIPEFKGEPEMLHIFLKRCETFCASLKDAAKPTFILNLIYKLGGKAFTIYESKIYNDWATLKKDLLEGIKISKSPSALQNELMNMYQMQNKSAKEFADIIKSKLKELSDIISAQYDNDDVRQSFKIEHEKIAIRAFREGLRSPL